MKKLITLLLLFFVVSLPSKGLATMADNNQSVSKSGSSIVEKGFDKEFKVVCEWLKQQLLKDNLTPPEVESILHASQDNIIAELIAVKLAHRSLGWEIESKGLYTLIFTKKGEEKVTFIVKPVIKTEEGQTTIEWLTEIK